MQTNLYRLLLVTLLVLLVASCSSVESDPDGFWNGVWRSQIPGTLTEARLTQEGDRVTGTIGEVRSGGLFHQKYLVEATANDTLATGHLIVNDTLATGHPFMGELRIPMHLVRQGDAIQIFVSAWSSFPILKKVQGVHG